MASAPDQHDYLRTLKRVPRIDEVVMVPAFDAVGATGDLCVTLTAALAISQRYDKPVIIDRGLEHKQWGMARRFDWSYKFRGGLIVWVS